MAFPYFWFSLYLNEKVLPQKWKYLVTDSIACKSSHYFFHVNQLSFPQRKGRCGEWRMGVWRWGRGVGGGFFVLRFLLNCKGQCSGITVKLFLFSLFGFCCCCLFFNFLKCLFFFDRERHSTSWGGAEREGDRI